MKKLLIISILCLLSSTGISQTYILDNIYGLYFFTNNVSTNLSYRCTDGLSATNSLSNDNDIKEAANNGSICKIYGHNWKTMMEEMFNGKECRQCEVCKIKQERKWIDL